MEGLDIQTVKDKLMCDSQCAGDTKASVKLDRICEALEIDLTRTSALAGYLQGEQQAEKVIGEDSFIASKWFVVTVTVTIVLNAIQMGIETELPGEKHPGLGELYNFLEWVFFTIFVTEMCCKMFVLHCAYFFSAWNNLDFFLILISFVDLVVIGLLVDGASEGMSQFGILRCLR